MAYSFLGLYLTNLFAFLFLLIAAIIFLIVPSRIINAPNATQTTTSNNQTARSLLYVAGILAMIVILIILFWIFYVWYTRSDETDLNKDVILGRKFGFGTFILVLLLFLMMIGAVVLAALSLSYIDITTTEGQDARLWVIAGLVFGVLAIIVYFISFFFYLPYNTYLDTLITPSMAVLAAHPMFSVNTTDLTNRKFSGKINITGQFEQPKEYIEYNGRLIEASSGQAYENVNVTFDVDEPKVVETVTTVPVVEKRVVNQPVVKKRVVEEQVLTRTTDPTSTMRRRPTIQPLATKI